MTDRLPVAVRVLLTSDTLFVQPGEVPGDDLVRSLRPGQRVALADARIGSRRRLRTRARRLGLRIEAEYAVLPSWGQAAFVVQDRKPTLRWLFATVATVPPGLARGAAAVDLGLRAATAMRAVRLAGHLAPGRLVIANRP
jgi:hypothetical protein